MTVRDYVGEELIEGEGKMVRHAMGGPDAAAELLGLSDGSIEFGKIGLEYEV